MHHQNVINKLNKSIIKIKALKPQVISIRKYWECYALILVNNRHWNNANKWMSGKTSISRSDIKDLSIACKNNDQSWATLFVVTMLWGYGESDDSGPIKLYFALKTNNADQIISKTAEYVAKADLVNAFIKIRELDEIGGSFGTKYLFAVGQAYEHMPIPLVLDSKIIKALRNLWGESDAEKLFELKKQPYIYSSAIKTAAVGYVAYCAIIQKIAEQLNEPTTPEHLEQFLFED